MRRSSRIGVLAIALVLIVVLGFLGSSGNVGAKDTSTLTHPAAATLDVTAKAPYTFDPNGVGNEATNATVDVTFTNGDNLAHTFTILNREGYVIKSSDDLAHLISTFGTLVNLVANGGTQVTGNFTAPGIGWYEFVCTESGHFQEGMYGFIAFGEALPSNLTTGAPSTGPGLAVFIITGTIVTLVVIALVLGFVVGRRRGAEHEMPPERLGYPEPPSPTGLPPAMPAPPPRPK